MGFGGWRRESSSEFFLKKKWFCESLDRNDSEFVYESGWRDKEKVVLVLLGKDTESK